VAGGIMADGIVVMATGTDTTGMVRLLSAVWLPVQSSGAPLPTARRARGMRMRIARSGTSPMILPPVRISGTMEVGIHAPDNLHYAARAVRVCAACAAPGRK